ncbi:MAG: hypothetical protein HYX33_03220 [Actinobacteria bacterium]|nr:hypothetical protein [Actinomycetota bacterium]
MASAPEAWTALIAELEPHVAPRWVQSAREHGGQGWIRLISLVDAHHQLSNPTIDEKVAMTMADLAIGREGEQAGWAAVQESAREARVAVAARVVDAAEAVLPTELLPLFMRSVDPIVVQM